MKLRNKKAGSKTLPNVEGYGKLTVPGRGSLTVEREYFEKLEGNPAIRAWVKAEHLVVEDDDEAPAKSEPSKPKAERPKQEPKAEPKAPDPPPDIHAMTVAEASKVIAEMTDADKLVAIGEKDQRDGIRKAVDARLERLTAPKG